MRKFKKSYLIFAALTLMFFTGCGKEKVHKPSNRVTLDENGDRKQIEFSNEIIEIKEDENIVFKTDVKDPKKFEQIEDMLGPSPLVVYGDANLKHYVNLHSVEDKNLNGEIVLDPKKIKRDIFKISNRSEISAREGVWPAYDKIYVAQYNDLKTGKKLDKILVHVVNIKDRKSQIVMPNVTETFTEDGNLRLEWQEMKDVASYRILKRTLNNGKRNGYFDFYNYEELASIKENAWTPDDEALKKMSYDMEDKDEHKLSKGRYELVVVAVDKEGKTSPESKPISSIRVGLNVIADINYSKIEKAVDPKNLVFEKIEDLPIRMPLKTIINYDLRRPIIFHNEEIKTEKSSDGKYKVVVPFTVKGTNIKKEITILKASGDYDNKLNSKLKNVKENTKTGRVEDKPLILTEEIKVLNQEISKNIAKVDTKYVANSSLEEFLVTNMLAGKTYLSLEGYPEGTDMVTLTNAIENLRNDNPIISSITQYNYSPKNKVLKIAYDKKKQDKQKQYLEKISKVIPTIIKDGMSDLEKSEAINNYIAKEVTYDFEALDAIEKFNSAYYKYGSSAKETIKLRDELFEKYGYAMDPEGVLLDGKAVCSGYSETYYLMATAAGLNAKVVTGNANGGLHAWNLVQIDGKWLVVDVTWNDNDEEPNKYLNISQNDPNYLKDHVILEKYKSFK